MASQTITGKLNKFLYQTNSGWGIALFKTSDGNAQIKIKGNIGLLEPKVVYELTGVYQEHPKYGKNFDVSSFKLLDLTTEEQYLSFFKEMIPGVGDVLGSRIIEAYAQDQDLFTAILQQPEKLDQVAGLKAASRTILLNEVKNLLTENKLTTIFFNNQLKMDFLIKLRIEFANREQNETLIETTLKTRFYEYAKHHHLIPFGEVDKVAMFFQELEPTSLVRLAWNINYLTEEILNASGNTYTSKKAIFTKFKNYLGIFDEALFDQALQEAINLKLIYEQSGIYFSDDSWNDELTISNEIIFHLTSTKNQLAIVQRLIDEVEQEVGQELKIPTFHYDDQQRHVLETFAFENLLLLNGGPGTGKTTVLQGLVKLYKKLNRSNHNNQLIAIAAPTGRAAARINEIDSHLEAKTIHKLLQATDDGSFEIDEFNPLDEELVIVDEASMIDNKLFASLLRASQQVKKIVIIGDENQLPSVGYGNVFANLLAIKAIPKVELKKIHRQTSDNGIIDLAYKVLNGEVKDESDFSLPNITSIFESSDPLKTVETIFMERVQNDPLNKFQVITSFYKGELGINIVNKNLQQIYQTEVLKKNLADEQNHTFLRHEQNFYPGDKVMYLVNETAIGLSNGDVGIIEKLVTNDNKLETSLVNFNDELKTLSSDNFNSLTLSYACSVHKTQGSEYDEVVFLVEPKMNDFFLNKKLVYTAITRAKKHLYLVGDVKTLIKAINREPEPRRSGLVGRTEALIEKGV